MLLESSSVEAVSGNLQNDRNVEYCLGKLTMLIKELALRISVDSNIRIQPEHLASPDLLVFGSQHHILQPSLRPQSFGKNWVLELKAVVDSDCVALFGYAGCRG